MVSGTKRRKARREEEASNVGRRPLPTTEIVNAQMEALAEIWESKRSLQERQPQQAWAHLGKAERELLRANRIAEFGRSE